jgi:branched-subunit amino acid ABC-type transport system permease component
LGTFVSIVIVGVVESAVLALAALAITLQFGVTNYFNFGFGEWLTFGAYVSLLFNVQLFHLNVWLTVPVAGLATAVLSIALNRAVFAPFVRRRPDPFFILIVTFAVGYVLNELYIALFSSSTSHRQRSSASAPSMWVPMNWDSSL